MALVELEASHLSASRSFDGDSRIRPDLYVKRSELIQQFTVSSKKIYEDTAFNPTASAPAQINTFGLQDLGYKKLGQIFLTGVGANYQFWS